MDRKSLIVILMNNIDRVRSERPPSDLELWRAGFIDGRLAAYENCLRLVQEMEE